MNLVTISAGAEDYTDAASMTYEEAIDVVSAVGIVGGYPDGSDEYYKVLFGTNLVAAPATTVDTFGRPATAWTYKGKEVGTYAKTADYTYYGSVKAGDLFKAMGKVEVEKVETRNNLLASTSTAWEDITATHNIVKDSTAQFGLGNCVIEFFDSDADSDSKKEVKTICIEYGVDTIKTVNAAKYDKDGEVKTKANVVLKNSGKSFETTAFAKDQVVLYALVNGAVKDLKVAESFEGKVTINGTNKTVTTNVVTGYKNIANQTAEIARTYDTSTKLFETVFVLAAAAEDTTDKTYAVLLDGTASEAKDADNTYKTYAVAIDGIETTLAKDDVVNYYVVGGTGTDKDDIAFVLVTRAE